MLLGVSAAFVVAVVAAAVDRLLVNDPAGGWFMYSPGTEPSFWPSSWDGDVLRTPVIWLAAVGLWFGFSWWLFRNRKP